MSELTEGHLNLLETIYDVLRTQERWPPLRYLENFLDFKFGLDIEELARTMPRSLTTLPPPGYLSNDQQEVQLTIEGLRHVERPGASDDVELFFRVFRRFVVEQKRIVPTVDAQPNPCLTIDGISTEWSIHPSALRRVLRVVAVEPWSASWTPISTVDQEGNVIAGAAGNIRVCADNRTLRRFRDAETLDAYLERRRSFFEPSRPNPPTVPDTVQSLERLVKAVGAARRQTPADAASATPKDWDAFIAHASADKESFVQGLADALKRIGLRVWFDDFELTVGDSLRQKIDEGLGLSKYGIVVLSPNFFKRQWPQRELDGLAGRQNAEGRKVILPVLHDLTIEDVRTKSPMLADLVGVSSDDGVDHVVDELLRAMGFPPPVEFEIHAAKNQP